jgi:hypothetical protein
MDWQSKVRQYAELKKQLAEIADREKQLKEEIRNIAIENGNVDDKGSYHLEVFNIPGVTRIINQRRVSKPFDPDAAETLLEEKNLLERCTVLVPILDEQEILAARYEDLLTDADIDTMFPVKDSWALIISDK